jgi:hypothetical protein
MDTTELLSEVAVLYRRVHIAEKRLKIAIFLENSAIIDAFQCMAAE